MKISFVTQYFFPEQVSNNNIARDLHDAGHEVSVTTAVPNYPEGRYFTGYSNREKRVQDWDGIEISRVRTVPRGASKITLMANFFVYALMASLKMLIRPGKPDVIFASQLSPVTMVLPAIVQKWRTGAPLVIWVQDIWPESATFTLGIKSPFLTRPLDRMCRWIYRRADLLLVQSAAFPQRMTRFGIPEDRMRVFPNSAPPTYRPLLPEDAPEQAALVPQDGFRIMFAGNIGESQDFDTILAAADLLRDRADLKWVIIGSGRDLPRVQQKVSEKGLDSAFVFPGRFPEEQMPLFFAHADAMLVTLKDIPIWALTVPYKVQCYLACGKPVVAGLGGEGARIVRDSGAGYAAEPSNATDLASCVAKMMDTSRDTLTRHGQAARRYFDDHFAREKTSAQLESWLSELSTDRHRQPGDHP